jgi:hypothetical protein
LYVISPRIKYLVTVEKTVQGLQETLFLPTEIMNKKFLRPALSNYSLLTPDYDLYLRDDV